MNIAVWILQGLLALSMLASGGMKVSEFKMAWANDFSDAQINLIASAEVVGAIGLIVPWATRIAPALTPVAAVCLTILMLGAARIHFALQELLAPPLVIGKDASDRGAVVAPWSDVVSKLNIRRHVSSVASGCQ